MYGRRLPLIALAALFNGLGVAQQPPPPPPAPPAAPPASVTFAVESSRREPPRFSLTVDLLGHATYEAEDADADAGAQNSPSYRAEFDVSGATRDQIFSLAQAVDYFQGDFEFHKRRVADTGRKTFTYRDGMRSSSASLNWSENKHIQQLMDTFESIALTQSLARRLAYLRRYDKLGLEAVLKRMEELHKSRYLGEVQAIAPLLRQIANDPGVMKLARDRARRLLDQAEAVTASSPLPRSQR